MRVLHLPTSTGGMPWGLASGENRLGLESEVLYLYNNWLDYQADYVLFKKSPENVREKLLCVGKRIQGFFKIRNKYNVFHFNFGTSLLDYSRFGLPPLLDLPFYNGKIVVTYNGCDARQKYPTMDRVSFSACHNAECYNGICNSAKLDVLKRKRIKKVDHYADVIFAVNPDLFYFLPERTKFLPYALGNWKNIDLVKYQAPKKKLKIVHAPTNRAAKGSDIIIGNLEKIKESFGECVEIVLVENIPNQKALQIYSEADLIIDQLLIGWYGGFAVEVMKMGKPVMAFVRKEDLKFIPNDMALDCQKAIINVNPDALYDSLCNIIENPHLLKVYREAALDYVNKWHDPLFVAKITKSAYES